MNDYGRRKDEELSASREDCDKVVADKDCEDCNFSCDCVVTHPELMKKAASAMPNMYEIIEIAELFKVLGDPTRARILWCLISAELCVCDIAQLLGMTHSAVSHQLRVLRQAKLVAPRRSGKEVYYSLLDDHVTKILSMAKEHIEE